MNNLNHLIVDKNYITNKESIFVLLGNGFTSAMSDYIDKNITISFKNKEITSYNELTNKIILEISNVAYFKGLDENSAIKIIINDYIENINYQSVNLENIIYSLNKLKSLYEVNNINHSILDQIYNSILDHFKKEFTVILPNTHHVPNKNIKAFFSTNYFFELQYITDMDKCKLAYCIDSNNDLHRKNGEEKSIDFNQHDWERYNENLNCRHIPCYHIHGGYQLATDGSDTKYFQSVSKCVEYMNDNPEYKPVFILEGQGKFKLEKYKNILIYYLVIIIFLITVELYWSLETH